MLLPDQLQLDFLAVKTCAPRELAIDEQARLILQSIGEHRLAREVLAEWDGRLRTAAGRADYRRLRISLNPRLREHGAAEVDRTLRHELAHLLAHSRAGRRKIQPHGEQWRLACRDLGIPGEQRCHSLPFPVQKRQRRYLYRCPICSRDFPRVRRFKPRTACLACCRTHNRGRYDARFILRLVQ